MSTCCSAEAEGEAFWSFLPANATITRCAEGSEDQKAAEAAWRGLDSAIQRLSDDAQADADAARRQLEEMLKLRCFHLAVENGALNLPTHPTALKAWWQDGGDSWLWSYVHLGEAGPINALRPQVALPPDPRRVLLQGEDAAPYLAPLLCAASDIACGAETRGWMERARAVWSRHAPDDSPWNEERAKDGTQAEQCEKGAPRSYSSWRTCLNEVDDQKVDALPLGRTRAPRDGWLVVTGRRGHYAFCDGVSVYDLATGSAYRAESCSGLALRPGGTVDNAVTDARRQATARSGVISIDNLREAAWLLLLKDTAESVHTHSRWYTIPRDLEPRFVVGGAAAGDVSHWSTTWTSGQTRLGWSWIANDGRVLGEGSLTWGSLDPLEGHAGDLLDLAERGFVEGCCPAALPAGVTPLWAGVNPIDALRESLDRVQSQLWADLYEHRSIRCVAPSP